MSSGAQRRRRKRASSRRTPTPTATPPPVNSDTPLFSFFAQFESFSFNSSQSSCKNYDRLAKVIKCGGPDDPKRLATREGFKDALVQEFNVQFGTDVNNLACWKMLCRLVQIEPVPDTIEECRKLLWDTHVNIIDLVDAAVTETPAKVFPSLDELTRYTIDNKRFFPKKNAYQGGLLKELLREILHPYFGKRRNGSAKKKERKKKKNAEAAPTIPTGTVVIEE